MATQSGNPSGAAHGGAAAASAAGAGDRAKDGGNPTSQISRLTLNQLKNQEHIIHRTKNCIIVAGQGKREDQEPVSYRNLLLFIDSLQS